MFLSHKLALRTHPFCTRNPHFCYLIIACLITIVSLGLDGSKGRRVKALAGATLTVNSAADTNNPNDGLLTLREAILISNGARAVGASEAGQVTGAPGGGLDNIVFALGTGTPTINVAGTALPTITNPVFINGNTGGATRVELNGAAAGAVNGLTIAAGNSRIKSLVINRFTDPAFYKAGIRLQTGGANTIEDCYLGTNASGTAAFGNVMGLHIDSNSSNNVVGGVAAGKRNLIAGNATTGLFISNGAKNNRIEGNYIGTDINGTADLGNGQQGVHVDGSTTANNVIGGAIAAARNVISGNTYNGVAITGGANSARIEGNFIGVNASGTAAIGNSEDGVYVSNNSAFSGSFNTTNNVIGGVAAGAGNLISGNVRFGLQITNGANNNRVEGNYIGTNAGGTAAIPNNTGIVLDAAVNNVIGGTTSGARNLISGNRFVGVLFFLASTGNRVEGNYIGTDVNGAADLGNGEQGVRLRGSTTKNNVIGGTTAAARNIISGNDGNGIRFDSSANNNRVEGNYIGTNAAGTAALGNGSSGVSIYDLGTSNNVIGGAAAGARNIISGNVLDGVSIGNFAKDNRIEGNYIGTDVAAAAAIGNGESGVRISNGGTTNNVIGGTMAGTRNVISGNVISGVVVDSGAMNNRVEGNYIGTDATGISAIGNIVGVWITEDSIVDNNTYPTGNNVIGGVVAGARNVISGNEIGISIQGIKASNNRIEGNYIGTNANGSAALGNEGNGVDLYEAPNNTIGGTVVGARNVISSNSDYGIGIFGADGNLVQGNYIGTDATGTVDLGNALYGVIINDASNNTIGGTTAAARNLISGNDASGIGLVDTTGTGVGVTNNKVLGNYIGADVTGTAGLGNSRGGVLVTGADNKIGGTDSGAGNVIAFNGGFGVGVVAFTGEPAPANNAILSNSIFGNSVNPSDELAKSGLGIDLITCGGTPFTCNGGVTANDTGDVDAGPNNLQNFPVVTSANVTMSSTIIAGTLNSLANKTFIIEFFSNPTCDSSGYGEGASFIGRTNVTTDGNGNASLNATLPVVVPESRFITATATLLDAGVPKDTSEFSQCRAVVRIPSPDLQITAASAPAATLTDSAFEIQWTLRNDGNVRAQAPWVDRILLSNDNQLGNDSPLAEFPLEQSLDPGQSAARIQAINIPRSAVPANGQYFLLIVTDANNNVTEEFGENNNVRALPIMVNRRPLPDLIVESVQSPNTAFFDQVINVQWTVRNIGSASTDAAEWEDWVILSADDIPEFQDPFTVMVQNISYLNVGGSYIASVDIRIPRGLIGAYNVIVYTDTDKLLVRQGRELAFNVSEENEGNNRKLKAININAPPLPDLQTPLVQAPDEGFTGQPMLVNWRVENRGNGTTPPDQTSWSDAVYLSKDTTFDSATDRLIGSRQRSGALLQNDGYTVNSFSVNIPNNIAGDWYVFVVADYQNAVYEFNKENNNAGFDAQRIRIIATPPEMIVQSVAAPATGTASRQITVNWTIKNQGAFEAPATWFDTVYISNDNQLNPATDTPLATIARGGNLGPGLTYAASAQVTLPACNAGAFYLFVFTDSRDQLFEFDPNYNAEANNYSQPKPIQITAIPPDLRVTAVGNPAIGNAGQPIAISWAVKNSGTGPTIEGGWTDNLYLSETPAFNQSAALFLGSFQHSGNLNPNESYSRSENIVVPTTAQGLYYVFVFTDAGDGVEECANDNNNTLAGATTININNNLPDLRVAAINAPATAFAGQTINLSWTGQNAGNAAAQNSAWNDRAYLSSDQTLDGSDRELATKLINGPLAINATYAGQTQVKIPIVAAGNYFLIVVADGDNHVFEGRSENNNTNTRTIQVQTPDVDLRVTTVDAPAQAFSGLEITVNWTINNSGTAQTFASQWTDRVIISRDQILDSTDRVIGYLVHDGALNGGASYNATLNVEIPQGLSGSHYIFVRTDAHNAVAETNENNNASYDTSPINLQLPPPVDLTVTAINIPSSGSPGEGATIGWTVKNQSNNTAMGRWTDALYLSRDQVWDIGDAEIGRADRNGPLAAGQTYTATLTAKLPPVTPGNYFVIVRTDVRNRVREENEANNTTASITAMNVDVPSLTLGVPANSTIQTNQERYYKVSAPGNETLRFLLDGQNPLTSNELFARFGLLPSRSAFDFSFTRPYEPDQEIIVPETQQGTYYSLTRGAFVPNGTDPFSIKAEILPFGITSVSPNRIGDNGQVTITIKGAKFKDGATVKLVNGGTILTAAKVWLVDSATVKARFLLHLPPHGAYSLTLTKPGDANATLEQAVVVEAATKLMVETAGTADMFPRLGRTFTWSGGIRNSGNVDISYLQVSTSVDQPLQVTVSRPTDALPIALNESVSSGVSLDNSVIASFTLRDIAPGEHRNFSFNVRGYQTPFTYYVTPLAMSQQEYVTSIQEKVELVRQYLLASSGSLLPSDVLSALRSSEAWWALIHSYYVSAGLLDVSNDGLRSSKLNETGRRYGILVDETPEICVRDCKVTAAIEASFAAAAFTLCVVVSGGIATPACVSGLILAIAAIDAKLAVCLCRCARKFDLNCGFPLKMPCETLAGYPCPRNAADPNDKQGPPSHGPSSFIALTIPQPYAINFENIPSATANAQRIRITDQLAPTLDWRTFRLKEIGFGSYRIPIPENRAFFQGRVQLGADLGNLLADISAGLDISSGRVTWTLTAIDPMTGEQPNSAALGLLPPNDQTGRGQGYVIYTIQPKAGLPTGAQISNKATIIFDTEEPITTNTVTNTLDADAPTSAVNSLPPSSPLIFTLSWSGSDAAGGSGIQSYDIWVSENNGPYQPFLTGATNTTAQFTGQNGKTYRFYSIARDNAGNIEAAPAAPDAVTSVGVAQNPVPTITSLNPILTNAGGPQFTLTVNGANFINTSMVNWNGSPRVTVFVSATQLTATVTQADIANAGNANVTVVNPAPGGGTSNAAIFKINALPVITPAAGLARQRGSAGIVTAIASVSDAETAAGNLIVAVNSAPAGLSITNIANTNGAISANIAASCAAVLGANTIVLKVTDGNSAMTTANLIVTVATNTPPALGGYAATTMAYGENKTIAPSLAPSDNGAITAVTVAASPAGFTGAVSVNAATGAVTINNAGPPGSYTVTVTANDNCNATSTQTIALTVNKASTTTTVVSSVNPSIVTQQITFTATMAVVAPGAGNIAGSVQFKDNGQPIGSPVALVNGVAKLTTSTLTFGIHAIAAEYSGNESFNISSHTVSQVVDDYRVTTRDPLSCTGPGNVLNVTAQLTNNGNATQTVSFTAKPNVAGQLFVINGSCNATGASSSSCQTTPSQVSFSGSLGAGQTMTIAYQMQVGDGIAAGVQVCADTQVIINDGPAATVKACTTINCQPVSLGGIPATNSPLTDQKMGSVLVYNLYTSSASASNSQNTRLNITNTHFSLAAYVHLFFVDGSECSIADSYVCLTAGQTMSFVASDLDPGTTGYLVAVAVDSVTGCPINFNYLIGDEYVKLSSGHAANLGATAFSALAGGLPVCNSNSTTAELKFDGVSYNRLPRVLAIDNLPSRADGNDTLLVINQIGGNLGSGASVLSGLVGALYDDLEGSYSFTVPPGSCQLRSSLGNNFPRTTPRFEQVIPAGRSGWIRLWSANDVGLLGTVINFNANARVNSGAFNQGRNLHQLTFANNVNLTIPIVPPPCR